MIMGIVMKMTRKILKKYNYLKIKMFTIILASKIIINLSITKKHRYM
ncbi:hypothetical protein VIBNISOn1_650010 [Vibrio nigripulchritudo SOn1]|uniref:Uncharacterized protein n=1 Tax=Vibrio nigripulchritudo SOn1 TaxID=1238450 RepID=A0AAV2VVT2_9VIBR|nr:hypothetical protein VIBNISOn1_650010 [Vibrio nigripulchritudo SOn1]